MPEDRNQMIEDGKKKEDMRRQKRQCISGSKAPTYVFQYHKHCEH